MKTNGPGKYDWLASKCRTDTDAALVAVIVVRGNLGGGFAVQAVDPELVRQLPDFLEDMARKIREENELS